MPARKAVKNAAVSVWRRLGFLCLAGLVATSVRAQSAGGLKIRVIDNADKTPVVGAAITLSHASQFVATATLITDKNGIALFPVLRAGSGYLVTVIMDGYAGIRQDAAVTSGITRELVIALAPEHAERVEIVDTRDLIDLDQSEAATKFSSDFIQDLPVAGRFYQNVLALAPGVQDPDKDGNPNVNGARDRDFKTTVSGISNVDPLTGQFLNLVTSDSIEDLTVVTAGAGAEYGRAQGGFAQIVQKQGSNDFEGVFGMLFSSRRLDGNGSTGIPDQYLPDFFLYQPSLQVSGPIVKDKLWYRLSQEYINREDPLVLAGTGAVATRGSEQFSTDNQITWQVSNRNKLALSFRADPRTQTNVGAGSNVPVESSEQFEFGGPTYALIWTAPYSPSLLVDTTVAYQDTELEITPMQPGVVNDCLAPAFMDHAQCFNAQFGLLSGSAPRSWKDSRQRFTVKSDATYFKGTMWGASHQFKFGLVVENERYLRRLERRPTFIQNARWNSFIQAFTYTWDLTASLQPVSMQDASGTTWGVYGEDVIRPISNLSITVGLRLEQENFAAEGYVPFEPQAEQDAFLLAIQGLSPDQRIAVLQRAFVAYESLPNVLTAIRLQFPGGQFQNSAYLNQVSNWRQFRRPADMNIHNTNIAPRLSMAWDPWNDGKSKLSISAGRYYDKIFLAVPAAESEPVLATFRASYAITQAFAPSFSYSTVDRNLKTPHQDEWSVAIERELWSESSLSLRYIHRSFKNQLQDINVNQRPFDYGRCRIPLLGTTVPTMIASPGVGPLVDPYTFETYEDTDPGNGDGRLDDCLGTFQVYPNVPGPIESAPSYARGDGIPDLYILNPGWADIFRIGNFNDAKYDGVTLEFVRRLFRNWQMEASYTYAKATGSGEDYNLILGDDRSSLADEPGYQSYDVRHAFKLNATTLLRGGVRLGGSVQFQSGLPYSILLRNTSTASASPDVPIGQTFTSVRTFYPTHQRNDQRNAGAWNFDVKVAKEFALKRTNLQLTAEIFNLFGEDTYVIYNAYTKSGQQLNGANDAYRRFGRQYQVGMRLAF